MKEAYSALCTFIECCANSLNAALDIEENKLSGYAILVTVMCEDYTLFISRDNFMVSQICHLATLPVSIAVKKSKTTNTVSFNKHVNAYIKANWKKHIMPFFRKRREEFHNNDENFSESLSECVNHYFYALLNDSKKDKKTQGNKGRNNIGELQNIWVKFYNKLLKSVESNEYFTDEDTDSREALLSSVKYFISTHRQEFSNNPIVVDGESFCAEAAEFYLILFMIAANVDPRVINLLFQNPVPEDISDKSELLEVVSELSGFIASPDISAIAKDIYLSDIYFRWVNNRHTQAVLFDRSVTEKEQLNTIIMDYLRYTDEYLSRKKKNEAKIIPFRECDLRNQEVISRVVPIILNNENPTKSIQLSSEKFKGFRHDEECGFVIKTDTDPNMDMWLNNWFKTFPKNDYSRNFYYYIQMNSDEIRWAAEHRELFVVRCNDSIVGAAIMSTNVNTAIEDNRSPYNGGKMRKTLEDIGIYEGAYACLNTVIVSSEHRGYRLQALLIDILIKLAVIHGKSYVVATVSDINSFSYNNFIAAGFVDIDKGKQPSECSVIYEINGENYPRHLVILDLRNRYKGNTEVPISRGSRLEKVHVMEYIKKYWKSEVCHNPQYYYYEGRNCQNFVSGVLVAGGFPLSPDFYPAVKGEDGLFQDASLAFVNVKEFISYMKDKIGIEYFSTKSEALANAEAFDVLITNDEGHSMIITNVSRDEEKGEVIIYAAGNTNDRDVDNVVDDSVIFGLLKTSVLFE